MRAGRYRASSAFERRVGNDEVVARNQLPLPDEQSLSKAKVGSDQDVYHEGSSLEAEQRT